MNLFDEGIMKGVGALWAVPPTYVHLLPSACSRWVYTHVSAIPPSIPIVSTRYVVGRSTLERLLLNSERPGAVVGIKGTDLFMELYNLPWR